MNKPARSKRHMQALLLVMGCALALVLGSARWLGVPAEFLWPIGMMLGAVFSMLGVVSSIDVEAGLSRTRAEELEATAATATGPLWSFVDAQLEAAAARQNVAVATAQGRASRMFWLGVILILFSVLVPFVLVWLYATIEPVPVKAGEAPQRDWHLLVAGVSFGLLFIAAARGILAAEGRQREVYAREVRETAYYGDLRRAVRMAHRLDYREEDERAEPETEQAVRKIVALMLESGRREHVASASADAQQPAAEGELLKGITDVFKKPA